MHIFAGTFWKNLGTDPHATLGQLRTERKRITLAVGAMVLFWRIVVGEFFQNHCLTRANALGFTILLTLIPLITLASYAASTLITVHPEQIERFISLFLPFAPRVVLLNIHTFFVNAQKLQGLSIPVLIVMSVGLFAILEESLNVIWKVHQPRSIYVRLRTFTMVMVYSPVLFAASFQVRIWSSALAINLPFDIAAFMLNLFAFIFLIWFAPNTRVRFKNAFWGGLTVAVLYELERDFFGYYVQFAFRTQEIYGAFGILVFFLFSLILVSAFILLGSEIAYVLQNFRPLLRTRRRGERRVSNHATYLGMRMLLDIIAAFRNRGRPPNTGLFEQTYELTAPQVSGILGPFLKSGLVHRTEADAFVPAIDFGPRLVSEALDLFEEQNRQIPVRPADKTRDRLTDVISRLKYHSDPVLLGITFEQLLHEVESRTAKAEPVRLPSKK